MAEAVDHPSHYGGDTTYETIKVIEAWELGFHLGNAVKYISRAGKKDPDKAGTDIDKAIWYLQRYLESEFTKLTAEPKPPVNKLLPIPGLYPTVKFKVRKPVKSFLDAYPEYFDYQMVANADWTIGYLADVAAVQYNLKHGDCGVYGISLAEGSGFLKANESVSWLLQEFPQPAYNYYLRVRNV